MSSYKEYEKAFLLKALGFHTPQWTSMIKHIVLGPPKKVLNNAAYNTSVKLSTHVHSPYFFGEKVVDYNRFSLRDYKVHKDADFLEVPHLKASNPLELINYMNEVYLNAVNVLDKRNPDFFVRGLQTTMKLETLKSFQLSSPQPGKFLVVHAREDSHLFEGSLKIKFF